MIFRKLCMVLSIIAGISGVLSQDLGRPKLKVSIIYEALCSDSIEFFAHQLGPNYDVLKDYIDVTMIPFSKSLSVNHMLKFVCQHGPEECKGNRQQLCVMNQSYDQVVQTKFVLCQMGQKNITDIEECTKALGLSSNITACMEGDEGNHLQLQAERVTFVYQPQFLPTIIYDGIFNQQLQDNSIKDFLGTVCHVFQLRGDLIPLSGVCHYPVVCLTCSVFAY
ncbi:gamma-interferon-inducible lysosomal thiol reductase-like [Musca autumnalis]|uniref:gamma-interferon-inducible lysosomal thiol reductase-like n=1 Tax=Musca autumnalis TaxID=221902 RepID=UPI003CFA13BD